MFPGRDVVEAGVGSGALSLWLLRAIGADGRLSRSSDARSSPTSRAATSTPFSRRAIPEQLVDRRSATSPRRCRRRSTAASVDRVDPRHARALGVHRCRRPTRCSPAASLLCYIATATQLSRVAEAIRGTGLYTEPQSTETMVRGWHVEGLAVRPDHRMIAHTGFLLDRPPPRARRRACPS